MNEQERSELEWLKQRHAKLEEDLSLLGRQLKQIESRLVPAEKPAAAVVAPPPPPPPPAAHSSPVPKSAIPPQIPPVIPSIPAASLKQAIPESPPASSSDSTPRPAPAPPSIPPRVESAKAEATSFEMRLGTYWLVRVGIVMLLTGLVFFGNYAYQNFIGKLGPAGKVSLLYFASGILLGAGAWWQRKAAKESLKNYAQVLFAGGLAAVYFTTCAAHYIENLRVIRSALLDGALLLGWAGFMVWIADRKKSEVLALFSVGLAYYTSVITRVGSFTLYSNLILTVAAVFFLVRNRWAGLTFASLIATYVAYGFWRFFDGRDWHWASPEQGLWHGVYFLVSYWIVFTAAVFLSKHEKFSGPNRASFLTLNNGLFFILFLLTMLQVRQGGFWKFSLGYGLVLLALAELARRMLAADALTKNSYLTQGLLLVTVGLISKFSGLQLALLLAAESVVLFTLGLARKSLVLQVAAYISGALSVGWGIDGLERYNTRMLCYNAAVGAMMVFNGFWSHRKSPESKALVRPVPAYFTILALISWLATTWYNCSAETLPLVLAIETVMLTASIYVLRMRELVFFGQGYLLLAHCAWLFHFMQPEYVPPWWNPVLMIAITLGLSHWWQKEKIPGGDPKLGGFWQGIYALAIVGLLYYWLKPLGSPTSWLVLTSLLAIGITAYGIFTRAWYLAACGQIFLLISAGQFALQLWRDQPAWYFPLAPIAVLIVLSLSAVKWFQRPGYANQKVRDPLLQLAQIYRWVALVMSIWWVMKYIPERERIWVLVLLGLLAFLLAGWRKISEALLFSTAFTLFGFGLFWLPRQEPTVIYLPNLFAILTVLVEQRIARRLSDRYPLERRAQGAMIFLGGLSLWLLLSRWMSQNASGFYLTASWSALALIFFVVGLLLRERLYRWLGLGILACALGRVIIFDIWKLEPLYRILSFTALGVVLLVLGFFYSKYQEKFKEWL